MGRAGILFTNFCWPLLDRSRNEKTNCKKRNKTKKKERKTEKRKKINYKEGRGKKPKIQACLNSQEIRKVNKVKKTNKQNKQKQVKKSYTFNNESTLIKTCTTSLF